jgi:integrase
VTASFQNSDIESTRSLPEDKHPAFIYLAQLGPGSRRTMTEALAKLARLASDGSCDTRSLPWHTLKHEQTSELRTQLASTLAPATTNKHLAALRGVLKQAWRLGLMTAEDYQRSIDLPAVHGPAPRQNRALNQQELSALVAACDQDASPAGARDAALFSLLFGAGLRRSEVVALELSDYDQESGVLRIHGTPSREPRTYLVTTNGRKALQSWLTRRGLSAGPLFNPVNKGGRLEIRSLSEQAIYIACRKRAAEAGLPPVSPEDLRRSLRTTMTRHPTPSSAHAAA